VAATDGADPEGAVQDGDRFAGLDEDSQLVVDALRGNDRVHIDTLSRDLGWPAAQTSSVLLLLEVQGLVHQWPGMEYSLE
jgi:DNA processing protein